MASKVKVAAAKAARTPVVAAALFGLPLLVTAILAPIGCGARDAGDLSYLSGSGPGGATSGGVGGEGSSATGSSSSVTSSSGAGGAGTSTSSSSSGAGGAGTGGAGTGGVGTGGAGTGGAGTGGAGTGGAGTGGASSSSSGGQPVIVLALPDGSGYRYWDNGSVAANWADPGFNDSGWSKGVAPLGFGDPHINTTVGFGPDPDSKYTSTWFRTTFEVKNALSVQAVTLKLLRDDGAMVFLNGVEAARSNMPNGAISPNTLATEIIQGGDETTFYAFAVDPALVVEGTNYLAIEVHQAVGNGSDLGIDARVILEQLVP